MNRSEIIEKVLAERTRQDNKWGEQNWPLAHEPISELKEESDKSKNFCNERAKLGIVSWRDILKEEFDEVFAESDIDNQETELVQVAAVAVSIIECLERHRERNESQL